MAEIEYTVEINGAANGVVVRIGCKNLVFKDTEVQSLMSDLTQYLTGGRDTYRVLYEKYFPDQCKDRPEQTQAGNECCAPDSRPMSGRLR
jgi:hypothetical protein